MLREALATASAAGTIRSRRIGRLARQSLEQEIMCWPKPGLVSHIDSGSHRDMDAGLLLRSAVVLEPYFDALAAAGAAGAAIEDLRRIGIAAEAAMLAATRGVNTHRGAIFGLGLLCAAAGVNDRGALLGDIVRVRWGGPILQRRADRRSHGGRVRARYGVGGARTEAAGGFPSVYGVGLSALRRGAQLAPDDPEAPRIEAIFALIAEVGDTNLLHRAGVAGLDFAQAAAREFLDEGGVGAPDWRRRAAETHESFVIRDLSPGGSADLLAMTLFVAMLEDE